MTSAMNHESDIIIVGAGMVGLATAAELARNGYQVTLIENSELDKDFSFAMEMRVSAINHLSQRLLQKIGAWQQIPENRLSVYRKMDVWEKQHPHHLQFNATDIAKADLGHIIENRVITTAIHLAIKKSDFGKNIHIFENSSWENFTIDKDSVKLELQNGTHVNGKLLIAADGARSGIRNRLNIPVTQKSYQQKALVALIQSEKPHARTAWQRFLETGPLAFLPMQDKNTHSIVWSMSDELANQFSEFSDDDFIAELEKAIDNQFGKLSLLSTRATFPLLAIHARRYFQHRVVLIGDAAHCIHPLAGQGVNLGFKDVDALTHELLSEHQNLKDPGSIRVLSNYQRLRKLDNQLTQKSMSLINNGFMLDKPGMAAMRGLGMSLLNDQTWIKKIMMKQATAD